MGNKIKWVSNDGENYHGISGDYSLEISRDLQGNRRWWIWHGTNEIAHGKTSESGEKAKEIVKFELIKHQ